MWKKIDKFSEYIYEKPAKGLLLILGGVLSFIILSSALIMILSSFLIKTTFFSDYTIDILQTHIIIIFWIVLSMLFVVLCILWGVRETKQKRRLKIRQLSEYVAKYQKYVDLVENSLKAEEYQTVSLPSEWVKTFDKHLTYTARYSGERSFTDFEVAACLMYALDGYNADVNFAFHCAKLIISKPNIYNKKYIIGNELILEINGTMEEVQFSNLDEDSQDTIMLLLKTYLLQRNSYYEALKLADFLRILYLSCDQ